MPNDRSAINHTVCVPGLASHRDNILRMFFELHFDIPFSKGSEIGPDRIRPQNYGSSADLFWAQLAAQGMPVVSWI